ncbi:MAG: pantetheine-phosphate adenylyltransferase [Actinomycetota bacterium]
MSVAVICPGSFDPVTVGHLDVFERAAARFDRVIVAVLDNPGKQGTFSADERRELIAAETTHLDNLEIDRFEGLLIDYCRQREVWLVCKGLRGSADIEYELQMAQMNRRVGGVETIFVSASAEHTFLSSSLIKEVVRGGGDVTGLVPERVADALRERLTTADRSGR